MLPHPHVVEDKVIHSYSPTQHVRDVNPCRVLQLHRVALQSKEVRLEEAMNRYTGRREDKRCRYSCIIICLWPPIDNGPLKQNKKSSNLSSWQC